MPEYQNPNPTPPQTTTYPTAAEGYEAADRLHVMVGSGFMADAGAQRALVHDALDAAVLMLLRSRHLLRQSSCAAARSHCQAVTDYLRGSDAPRRVLKEG